MKVMLGDTVVLKNESGSPIGIVTQRSGNTLTVRRPDQDNALEKVSRNEVEPLADWMIARSSFNEMMRSASLSTKARPMLS